MIIKNIKVGSNKFFIVLVLLLFFKDTYSSDEIDYLGKKVDIKILDKLSSKNKLLKLDIGENFVYKNLSIKVLKCKNSEFDDNPEITSYLQVKDSSIKDNDKVFVFNGWTFSSSTTLKTFDHPVYDLWLTGCENI